MARTCRPCWPCAAIKNRYRYDGMLMVAVGESTLTRDQLAQHDDEGALDSGAAEVRMLSAHGSEESEEWASCASGAESGPSSAMSGYHDFVGQPYHQIHILPTDLQISTALTTISWQRLIDVVWVLNPVPAILQFISSIRIRVEPLRSESSHRYVHIDRGLFALTVAVEAFLQSYSQRLQQDPSIKSQLSRACVPEEISGNPINVQAYSFVRLCLEKPQVLLVALGIMQMWICCLAQALRLLVLSRLEIRFLPCEIVAMFFVTLRNALWLA